MEMMIVSAALVGMECMGFVFISDTFLERKKLGRLKLFKFLFFWTIMFCVAWLDEVIGMYKLAFSVSLYVAFHIRFYKASAAQSFFFAVLHSAIAYSSDYVWVIIWLMLYPEMLQDQIRKYTILPAIIAKTFWLLLLIIIRKIWKHGTDYRTLSNKEWLELSVFPGFTLTILLCMHVLNQTAVGSKGVFLLLTIGLMVTDFLVIHIIQDILEKEEKIRAGMLTNQNQKSQLEAYQDKEEIYRAERRKMHDYKNQLSTIQTLIKGGDVQSALAFAEKLTESISVDMSAIHINHPVFNAVLTHKYRSMQEKHIPLILQVGDLRGVHLEDEEIVILISNLLDNAIRESENVLKNTGKAVIHLKLAYENDSLILAVRNPVLEKVEIVDGTVQKKYDSDGHGIGLLNVKAIVDKYEGDMVLSCDDNEFKVVIIL